jgi:CDP-paratose 2-epimerase
MNIPHFNVDFRDGAGLNRVFHEQGPLDLIVQCAAQPSHDLSGMRPLDEFAVNAWYAKSPPRD